MTAPINHAKIVDALLRSDLRAFVERAFRHLYPGTPYLDNWHIWLICAELEAMMAGTLRRSLICLPPRHLKSFIASVCFPAWAMGRDPTMKFVCVSYSQDLSESFAHQFHKIVESDWYRRAFPTMRLDPGRSKKSDFATTRNGHRIASSVTGTLTGKGGDFIILDDLIKAGDVYSDTVRESVNEWFNTTLQSRLDNPNTGRILVVAQRLHVDDLPGRLIERGGWHTLILPLIASTKEAFAFRDVAIGRQAGALLHPERIDLATANALRNEIGTQLFEAQYNQRPLPPGGATFKGTWIKRYDAPPGPHMVEAVIQSWDTAYQNDEHNDYSVCTTWAKCGSNYHLLDVWRDRPEFWELERKVHALKKQWNAKLVIVELAGSGISLYQNIHNRDGHRWLVNVSPEGAKISRAQQQTPKFEQGRIWLPKAAPWLAAYESELFAFPHAKHDDQVDSTIQFLYALEWNKMQLLLKQGL